MTINRTPHPVLARVRSLPAVLAASLRQWLHLDPHVRDFTSQRMCPFCQLITPRFESRCLECGKAFGSA
jgi:hypothetical protein